MLSSSILLTLSWCVHVIAAHDDKPDYSNHIFNAIHSSMRQWGSSLNHNGMSYFLVTVPQDTTFYHGRATNDTVVGMEWVAFEPEHALVFARPRFRHPPPEGELDGHPDSSTASYRANSQSSRLTTSNLAGDASEQDWPLDHGRAVDQTRLSAQRLTHQQPEHGSQKSERGYLHVLSARHELRLLYIDGMAAGKCEKGTLDSTDYILLNRSSDGGRPDGPAGGDYTRAEALCALAQNRWQGRIDGFLRMEAGFEVIVCSFEDSLNTLSKRRTKPNNGSNWLTSFEAYMQAVSSRYDGIGGHRVTVNYEDMVTAFAYSVDLFGNGSLPRLKDVQSSTRSDLREDVESLVTRKTMPAHGWLDWQAVADMIVARWGNELAHLQAHNFTDLEEMQREVRELYRPYIDQDHRSAAGEVYQCAMHFMPRQYHTSVASDAISAVARRICHSLHEILQLDDMSAARAVITNLVEFLQWPSWKRCVGCTDKEVCFIPIWPFGSTEDHDKPSCLTTEHMQGRQGYWNSPGAHPPTS